MSTSTNFYASHDDLFVIPSAPENVLGPTKAPAITFLWDCHNNTVIIPRSRDELIDNPGLPSCDTISIRTLFNRHELHFDVFNPGLINIREKAINLPRGIRAVRKWEEQITPVPEKVHETLQCPICIDGTKPEVMFRECCHAFCIECTVALGSSPAAKRSGAFACPLCRMSVMELAAVIPHGVNHGDSGYHIKYDEETFAKLNWMSLNQWMLSIKGHKLNVDNLLVVRLKEDGEMEVKHLSGWGQDIEVPFESKPMGMAIVTWVLVCFTKMVAMDMPMQS
ncbi:uncharacterized protein H6S33_006301 [Morchella sextelata]|uniref:uncharacterized protein n=1 Tax=Morchella sextelata TaxID=1174677 RepID=UPI001D039F5D|nr:uncharacterized protein H6S33_006301 [Morchella sextelata]KAH0604633.1 hypothetical protein H6S33_006301 [Morchella sextelata]